MTDQRAKILESWRRRHAEVMRAHAAALKVDRDAARKLESELRQLAKAIRSYTEEKKGELTAQAGQRNQRAAADRFEGT